MRITKTYLKQVINEEIQKLFEKEAAWYDEAVVKMKAVDFLKLTTDEDINAILSKRFKLQKMDYYYARSGDLYLLLNKYEKVISHEGRNRAYASIKKYGPEVEVNVLIRIEENRIDDMTYIIGQYNDKVGVKKQEFKIIKHNIEEKVGDFLDVGQDSVKFKTDVFPPDDYMPQERIVSGYKQFLEFIGEKYAPYARNYKKLHKIEDFYGEEMSKFYKSYIDLINEKYKFYDSKGPLKLIFKGYRKFELDRTPDPKDTITIERK